MWHPENLMPPSISWRLVRALELRPQMSSQPRRCRYFWSFPPSLSLFLSCIKKHNDERVPGLEWKKINLQKKNPPLTLIPILEEVKEGNNKRPKRNSNMCETKHMMKKGTKAFYNIRFMHKTMIIIILSSQLIYCHSSFFFVHLLCNWNFFSFLPFFMRRTRSGHESRIFRCVDAAPNRVFDWRSYEGFFLTRALKSFGGTRGLHFTVTRVLHIERGWKNSRWDSLGLRFCGVMLNSILISLLL